MKLDEEARISFSPGRQLDVVDSLLTILPYAQVQIVRVAQEVGKVEEPDEQDTFSTISRRGRATHSGMSSRTSERLCLPTFRVSSRLKSNQQGNTP